jgi:hypothetical protein
VEGAVSTSVQFIVVLLMVLGYLVAPITLLWGWAVWALRPKSRNPLAMASLLGLVLASASAVVAVCTIGYAQVHHFPYYDPLLLRIFGIGALLSLVAVLLGIVGLVRANSLRWYSPLAGVATLAFWIMAAVGE